MTTSLPMICSFRELSVGDTFDFVAPSNSRFRLTSFYDRCRKVSARKYVSLETGTEYKVGSVKVTCYHCESSN